MDRASALPETNGAAHRAGRSYACPSHSCWQTSTVAIGKCASLSYQGDLITTCCDSCSSNGWSFEPSSNTIGHGCGAFVIIRIRFVYLWVCQMIPLCGERSHVG
jgi:hypothetical protein